MYSHILVVSMAHSSYRQEKAATCIKPYPLVSALQEPLTEESDTLKKYQIIAVHDDHKTCITDLSWYPEHLVKSGCA